MATVQIAEFGEFERDTTGYMQLPAFGEFSPPTTHTETASGGVEITGTAAISDNLTLSYTHITLGGVSVSGEAAVDYIAPLVFLSSGGVEIYGEADVQFTNPVFNPSGGFIISGEANDPLYVASGGIQLSGSADVVSVNRHVILVDGGLQINGVAPISDTFTPKSTGGVKLSGVSGVRAKSPLYIPSGGAVLGGRAIAILLESGRELTPENPYGDVFTGWAINYETNAASRYENLPINSICTFKGRVLVANEGGIYELGAASDAGQPIMASIVIAKTDFGIRENKRVPYMYLGYQSEDNLRVSVYTNKKSMAYYDTERPTEGSRGSRATLGRGLDGLYWSFRVSNMNGAYFELDTIKIEPTILRKMGV